MVTMFLVAVDFGVADGSLPISAFICDSILSRFAESSDFLEYNALRLLTSIVPFELLTSLARTFLPSSVSKRSDHFSNHLDHALSASEFANCVAAAPWSEKFRRFPLDGLVSSGLRTASTRPCVPTLRSHGWAAILVAIPLSAEFPGWPSPNHFCTNTLRSSDAIVCFFVLACSISVFNMLGAFARALRFVLPLPSGIIGALINAFSANHCTLPAISFVNSLALRAHITTNRMRPIPKRFIITREK